MEKDMDTVWALVAMFGGLALILGVIAIPMVADDGIDACFKALARYVDARTERLRQRTKR